jgi:uncharacterized protein YjdB
MSLSTIQQAKLLDGNNAQLLPAAYSAYSSDHAVATIAIVVGALTVVAQGAGSATITATRVADGATATLVVDVAAAAGFTIQLGAPFAR